MYEQIHTALSLKVSRYSSPDVGNDARDCPNTVIASHIQCHTKRIVLDFVTFLPGDEIPVVIGNSPEGSTIT